MLFLEVGDARRQEIERQGLAAGDLYRAPPQASEVLDLRQHPLGFGDLAARIAHEHLARGRQPHAARTALEQRRSDLGLEILNAAVHRRRRQIETLGRLSDRARCARPRPHWPAASNVACGLQ